MNTISCDPTCGRGSPIRLAMQPLAEPVPESRLADVLMGELFPRQELDDTFVDLVLDDLEPGDSGEVEEYAAYEIVRDAFATTEFVRVRDTRYDHIVTVEFPRELALETAPVVKVSAPYERIDIEHDDDNVVVERIHVDVAEDEMQLDLEDLEVEHDFFAQGDEPRDAQFMAYTHARPFPLYSAPFERVELGELPVPVAVLAGDSTEMVVQRRSGRTSAFVLAVVLICAAVAAVGLALLVVRSATG